MSIAKYDRRMQCDRILGNARSGCGLEDFAPWRLVESRQDTRILATAKPDVS
ncbi:MAG: hypothetical protein U7126_27490 [Microcoleus sp.]